MKQTKDKENLIQVTIKDIPSFYKNWIGAEATIRNCTTGAILELMIEDFPKEFGEVKKDDFKQMTADKLVTGKDLIYYGVANCPVSVRTRASVYQKLFGFKNATEFWLHCFEWWLSSKAEIPFKTTIRK